MASDTSRLQLAQQAATAGGAIATDYFRNNPDADLKSDNTLVTEADRTVQHCITTLIRDTYPTDTIVGEEDTPHTSTTVPDTGHAWIIDPIDGTDNFARGQVFWAVSIAVVEDRDPIAAVNVLPALGETYVASPGGVTRNGEAVTASNTTHDALNTVSLFHYWPPNPGPILSELAAEFDRFSKLGCSQATLAQTADGTCDAALTLASPPPWDTVAGAYMVDRAGGRITDLNGNPWTLESAGLVATNGDCHDHVLDLIADADPCDRP